MFPFVRVLAGEADHLGGSGSEECPCDQSVFAEVRPDEVLPDGRPGGIGEAGVASHLFAVEVGGSVQHLCRNIGDGDAAEESIRDGQDVRIELATETFSLEIVVGAEERFHINGSDSDDAAAAAEDQLDAEVAVEKVIDLPKSSGAQSCLLHRLVEELGLLRLDPTDAASFRPEEDGEGVGGDLDGETLNP